MANKEKKRKDKKRRQRRERKSKLPSSVEALLGYLGGGGPGPAIQGDTKPRERAGVDAYDTLHQIIKSQQMQNANYMANLERMAFQKDITNQLKKQGEESMKALEETKAEVRQYTRSSTEAQIEKINRKIAYQLRLKAGPNAEMLERLQADKKRYEGMLQFETGSNSRAQLPSAVGIAPASTSATVRAGGDDTTHSRISVAQAQATTVLPAHDTNYSFIASKIGALSPQPPTSRRDEIKEALDQFSFNDSMSSSLDARNISIALGRQQKQVARKETEVFGDAGTRRSSKNK